MVAQGSRSISKLALLPLLLLLLASCATTGSRGAAPGRLYAGRGTGESPLAALNAAKMNAVWSAVVEMMGREQAEAHRTKIEGALADSENPNAYVYNGTLHILRTGGDPISYDVEIRVNTEAVKSLLSSLGIAPSAAQAGGSPPAPASAGSGAKSAAGAQPLAAGSPPPAGETSGRGETSGGAGVEGSGALGQSSPDEQARIQRDLAQITYMVYYEAGSPTDPFIMRSAVNSADSYLADNGLPYIDQQQIESLVADQQKVYEEETHKSVGLIQWVAQKLHADVYIVVEVSTSSESRGGRYYGSADVTLRSFESSTGMGRGAANFASVRPSVSLVSTQDALLNAVNSATYRAIGEAVRQARAYLARELSNGIAYDLIMLNTPDDRVMSSFVKDLRRRVRGVRLLSSSSQETRYRVLVSGTAGDLQELVYQAASATPGLEGMRMVLLRGRELTFDTGS